MINRKMTLFLLLVFIQGQAAQGLEQEMRKAVFAGGCFWCMEPPFDKIDGVIETISGYTGGSVKNPDYKTVTSGRSGHYEVIEVTFDPKRVRYVQLLEVFWQNIDPLDASGQFCDKGPQYKSAIFYLDAEQRQQANQSLQNLNESGKLPGQVVTEVLQAQTFYPAESYHQDYYLKNPLRYKFYRTGCGRDRRLFELWGEKKDH